MDTIPDREIRVIQVDDSQLDEKFKQRLAEVSDGLPPVIIDTIKERLLIQKINYEAELDKLIKHHEQVSLNTIVLLNGFYRSLVDNIKINHQEKKNKLINCYPSVLLDTDPDTKALIDDDDHEFYTRSIEAVANQTILALRKKGYKCSSKYMNSDFDDDDLNENCISVKLDFTE